MAHSNPTRPTTIRVRYGRASACTPTAHSFSIPSPNGLAEVEVTCHCGAVTRVHRMSHSMLSTPTYNGRNTQKLVQNGRPTDAHPFKSGFTSAQQLKRARRKDG